MSNIRNWLSLTWWGLDAGDVLLWIICTLAGMNIITFAGVVWLVLR